MKRQNKKIFLTLLILTGFLWNALPLRAQQISTPIELNPDFEIQESNRIYKNLLEQSRGAEFPEIFEKISGDEAQGAIRQFNEDSERLIQALISASSQKAAENLQKQIEERKKMQASNRRSKRKAFLRINRRLKNRNRNRKKSVTIFSRKWIGGSLPSVFSRSRSGSRTKAMRLNSRKTIKN